MFQLLGTAKLKTGETLEIGVVTGSDDRFSEAIQELLAHKGDHWRAHIRAALARETGDLETRFYIGLLESQQVANIMTVESHGVGILGHVFTRREHRRKGICQAVMARQMQGFTDRTGKRLLLGTGYESPPYWIYHSFGFRSIREGFMRFAAPKTEGFEEEWFAPGSATIEPAAWEHWPRVAYLASTPRGEALGSLAWSLFDIGNLEGPYCGFMDAVGKGSGTAGRMLISRTGAVIGCATVTPHRPWPGIWLVDLSMHPNFQARSAELLQALPLPKGRSVCHIAEDSRHKATVAEAAGFRREAVLPGHLRSNDRSLDVWIYGKETL
jgi:hypothetical protein